MSNRWHRDPEVDKALIRLIDALCTWERNTGRGSVFLLMPNYPDEETIIAVDGKPIETSPFGLMQTIDHMKARIEKELP